MDFFGLFKNRKKGSGSAAKERLQFVLVHDRTGVSPELLDKLKGEILEVIAKYIEIDQQDFDIQVTRTKSEDGERVVPALVANIPISKMKADAETKLDNDKQDAKKAEEKTETPKDEVTKTADVEKNKVEKTKEEKKEEKTEEKKETKKE